MPSGWLNESVRAAIYHRDRFRYVYCGVDLLVGAHNSNPDSAVWYSDEPREY